MRHYSAGSLILMFFVFSFVGWLWEVSFHLYEDGMIVNRGIMHGPWLPIYGFGGVLILTLLYRLRKSPTMELANGGIKWWDYSGYFLNLDGRICAEGLLVFGIGGFAVVYLIAPALDNLFRKMKPAAVIVICAILLSVFVCDQIYSLKYPNEGEGITFTADGSRQSPGLQGHPQDDSSR